MQFAGTIATKQHELDAVEQVKEEIQKSNEENRSKKLLKTCEHGQMLMTVSNVYLRCFEKFQTCYGITKDPIKPETYDNIDEGNESFLEEYTYKQLESVYGVINGFK